MALYIDTEIIERFSAALSSARNIVIISHQNPDGDAIGSSLACRQWLLHNHPMTATDVSINILLPHPPLDETAYLPDSGTIVDAVNDMARCQQMLHDADLVWGVDFNDARRVQPLDNALTGSTATKILVDHHHHPDTTLFDTVLSVPDLSSTCELLYWLFVGMGGKASVNDSTARCLYHGINTDTGNFSYACEDASLYEATAALMEHPIGAAEVHNTLYNNYTFTKMRLLAFLLHDRLRIFEKERFAYFYITASDLEALGATPPDLEGIVNYTLMMKEIQVGVIVKEIEGQVRLSFRSKHHFDVNRFAHTYFNGGGHTKASGATSPYGFDETIRILEENMLKELRNDPS